MSLVSPLPDFVEQQQLCRSFRSGFDCFGQVRLQENAAACKLQILRSSTAHTTHAYIGKDQSITMAHPLESLDMLRRLPQSDRTAHFRSLIDSNQLDHDVSTSGTWCPLSQKSRNIII